MNKLTTNWINEAIFLAAEAASKDEVPVGAVVVLDDQIIGRGYNRREMDQDATAHAEILAIRDACDRLKSWRLENCILIVTLEPCPMCLGAIQQARIKHVYYGVSDPKGGALSLGYCLHQDERTHHRFSITDLKMQECGDLLSHFFQKKRKSSKSKK